MPIIVHDYEYDASVDTGGSRSDELKRYIILENIIEGSETSYMYLTETSIRKAIALYNDGSSIIQNN